MDDRDRGCSRAVARGERREPGDGGRGLTVVELVHRRAELTPGAPAIVSAGGGLTYGELDRLTAAVAAGLRALGVTGEAVVGLCMDRSPEQVVAILGVLRAGAAFCPLDPSEPAPRLAFMLETAGARLCLVPDGLTRRLPRLAGVRYAAPSEWLTGADAGPGPPAPPPTAPGRLAYVMFTSGSTGRPKGVMIEHGALANRVRWFCREFGLGPDEVAVHKTPCTFDVALPEILCPLLAGGRVVVARPDGHRDSAYLAALVRETGATTIHFVPSMLAAFLDEPGVEACTSLRRVLSSGETLPAPLRERFHTVLGGGCELVNLYGPTETAIEVSAWRCRPDAGRPVPIGHALPGVRLAVLDEGLRPVPDGELGELVVAGAQVARGYRGRPDLTAERFVPEPGGGRAYRTGDLARRRQDGALEFAGRRDDQVKIRGFRVEPGEVEARLLEHPAVREAAVVAAPGPAGDLRLVAYVVPRAPGPAPAPAEVARFLEGLLPAHMVPAAIVGLDDLPRTSSGKVDRRALPSLHPPPAGRAREEGRDAGDGARRERLGTVLAIWEEVLGLPGLPADADFLSLGGHSLHAVRVLARVAGRMGVRLQVRDLLEARTPRGLAARVEAADAGEAAAGRPAPRPAGEEAPPSLAQRRLWLVDQLTPRRAAYNVPLAVRLRGALDVSALAGALAAVISRHEVLRSRFPAGAGEPRLEILPPWRPALAPRDGPADPAAVAALVDGEAARPFDLAAGPLLRAGLWRMGADDHLLVLTMHHAVTDGWSLHVLARELSALYRAAVEGRPADLDPLPLQFADFAAWQRRRLTGPVLDRLLEHWRRALAGAPPALQLAADRPRLAVASHRGERRSITLAPALTGALEDLARRDGATLFTVLLAAFDVLLQRLGGTDDVVVGTPVAGRDHPELEGLAGFFVNVLPLRADLSGDPSFRQLVGRVRQAALAAFQHQEIPFELLVGALGVERDLGRSPVFQVVFNMYTFDEARLDLPGLRCETLDEPTCGSLFDCTLYVKEERGRLRLDAVYSPDLFDAARMEELLEQYRGLLEQVAAAPDRRLGDLSLVTPRARSVLPDPRAPLPPRPLPSLEERFAAHVAAGPDRPAVADGVVSLTRAGLDAAAARLAARLRDAGLGAGDVVAVHAARRASLAVALLGVLRAGCAFCVLDAGHPARRLVDHAGRARPAGWIALVPPAPELAAWLAAAAPRCVIDLSGGAPPEDASPRGGAWASADDAPAYLAFTSGSSGQPRAVVGTRAPLWHFLDWYEAALGAGAGDRYAMLGGLSHDPLLRDVLTPLWTGAELHVPAADVLRTPARLLRWLREREVTVLHLTPLLARLLRQAAAAAGGARLPAVRLACCGGDVLLAVDAEGLAELAPNARLVGFYGATETPQAVAWHPLPAGGAGSRPVVPAGRGIAGVQLLVLAGDRPAGVGELGEIAVRTAYLAAGYLDDPAATAERFVPNPCTGDPADRVYRTGDLGRYLPDGAVEFAGRRDRQVKVRGFRVEPAEVEQVLRGHPAVAEAVVVPAAGQAEQALVAYVVPGPEPAGAAELLAWLRERLPEYMCPAAVVRLDRLPLTPNGKLDVRALPAPDQTGGPAGGPAPRDRLEQEIAAVWREVLRLPAVGVEANFFDLGGSSLALVEVQARLARRLGRELSVVDLFRYPQVSALAAFLRQGASPLMFERADRRAAARLRAHGTGGPRAGRGPGRGGITRRVE